MSLKVQAPTHTVNLFVYLLIFPRQGSWWGSRDVRGRGALGVARVWSKWGRHSTSLPPSPSPGLVPPAGQPPSPPWYPLPPAELLWLPSWGGDEVPRPPLTQPRAGNTPQDPSTTKQWQVQQRNHAARPWSTAPGAARPPVLCAYPGRHHGPLLSARKQSRA